MAESKRKTNFKPSVTTQDSNDSMLTPLEFQVFNMKKTNKNVTQTIGSKLIWIKADRNV